MDGAKALCLYAAARRQGRYAEAPASFCYFPVEIFILYVQVNLFTL